MPNITITGGSVCSGGNHRTVTTDQGTARFTEEELLARPGAMDELRDAFVIVVRHQYLTRRASGRTHAQALQDLVGFVVRL